MHRTNSTRLFLLLGHLVLAVGCSQAQPPDGAVASFQRYTAAVEQRLLTQHQMAETFVARTPQAELPTSLMPTMTVEQLSPAAQPAGALLHHWRGTAFAPGATAAQFEHLLRDYRSYPVTFAPEVVRAQAQPTGSNRVEALLRVRQTHVLTVVLDASYDVSFGQLNAGSGFSTSRSTRIAEIDSPDTDHERALAAEEEHGYLWRLNTYWTYQQRPDGLVIQVEAVSLSRSLPVGLGWVLQPYVRSVPRESLEFTLRSALRALHR